jgi:hypothetical protein
MRTVFRDLSLRPCTNRVPKRLKMIHSRPSKIVIRSKLFFVGQRTAGAIYSIHAILSRTHSLLLAIQEIDDGLKLIKKSFSYMFSIVAAI